MVDFEDEEKVLDKNKNEVGGSMRRKTTKTFNWDQEMQQKIVDKETQDQDTINRILNALIVRSLIITHPNVELPKQ